MQSIVRNEARRLRRGPARDDLPLEEADAAMYVRKAHRRHEPRISLVSS